MLPPRRCTALCGVTLLLCNLACGFGTGRHPERRFGLSWKRRLALRARLIDSTKRRRESRGFTTNSEASRLIQPFSPQVLHTTCNTTSCACSYRGLGIKSKSDFTPGNWKWWDADSPLAVSFERASKVSRFEVKLLWNINGERRQNQNYASTEKLKHGGTHRHFF